MGPHSAVAAPHSTTTTSAHAARTSPTRWPRDRATSSPRARVLRYRPHPSAISRPITMNGAACSIVSALRDSVPTCQKRYWSKVSVSLSTRALVTEPSAAVVVAPASASLTGVAPSRPSALTP